MNTDSLTSSTYDIKNLAGDFIKLYGGTAAEGSIFSSPARINIIGEHTDYNGGYVFPGAIDCGIMAEIRPNGSPKVRAFSLDYDEYVGRIAVGRLERGIVKTGMNVVILKKDDKTIKMP